MIFVMEMDVRRAINAICDYLNWDDDRLAAAAESQRFPKFDDLEPTIRPRFVFLTCTTYSTSWSYFVLFSVSIFVLLTRLLACLTVAPVVSRDEYFSFSVCPATAVSLLQVRFDTLYCRLCCIFSNIVADS